MRLNSKYLAVFLGIAAAALVVDNFRLRITCHALENVVNYAVGGIHLDGVGGLYDPDDEVASEVHDKFDAGSGTDPGFEND